MKRICVNEKWRLGCHLCEYNCAFANSGMKDMALALIRNRTPLAEINFGLLWKTAAFAAFPAETRGKMFGGAV